MAHSMKKVLCSMLLLVALFSCFTFLSTPPTFAASSLPSHHTSLPHPNTTNACPPTIRSGSTGTYVVWLQEDLNWYYENTSYFTSVYPLAEDGIFGSNTNTAVRDFQSWAGIGVDGIVGPQTWAAIGEC
jgi:lysozyme